MDVDIRAEAVITPKDYVELTHFLAYGKSKSASYINMLLLMAVFVAVYADFVINGSPTSISAVAAAALIISYGYPEYAARRAAKRDTAVVGHNFKYLFNENGINIFDETASTTVLFAWAEIMNLYEIKDYFYVFMSKANAVMIPKRCLNAEDLVDFRELVQFQMGARFENRVPVRAKRNKKNG